MSGALVGAILDTVAVFLDAFGARAATTGARAAAKAQFETADLALRAQMKREAQRRAVRGAVGEGALTAAGTGAAVVEHEFFDQEPEMEATGESVTLDAPSAKEDVQPVSRVALQRNSNAAAGEAFEAHVDRALRRGEIRIPGITDFDYMIAGQYTGSGWGIDHIGIAVDPAGRVHIFHFEMKMQQMPRLGKPALGTQTGKAWTADAVESLLISPSPQAEAARRKLRRALKIMYPGAVVDSNVMREFLVKRLRRARVVIFVPNLADLRRLWRQVGGLARHGRRAHRGEGALRPQESDGTGTYSKSCPEKATTQYRLRRARRRMRRPELRGTPLMRSIHPSTSPSLTSTGHWRTGTRHGIGIATTQT